MPSCTRSQQIVFGGQIEQLPSGFDRVNVVAHMFAKSEPFSPHLPKNITGMQVAWIHFFTKPVPMHAVVLGSIFDFPNTPPPGSLSTWRDVARRGKMALSLGCDPAIFLQNNGVLLPAFEVLPKKGEASVFWDGFQAEFATKPASLVPDLEKEVFARLTGAPKCGARQAQRRRFSRAGYREGG